MKWSFFTSDTIISVRKPYFSHSPQKILFSPSCDMQKFTPHASFLTLFFPLLHSFYTFLFFLLFPSYFPLFYFPLFIFFLPISNRWKFSPQRGGAIFHYIHHCDLKIQKFICTFCNPAAFHTFRSDSTVLYYFIKFLYTKIMKMFYQSEFKNQGCWLNCILQS